MSDEHKEVTRNARSNVENSAGPSQIQNAAVAADPLASSIFKLDIDCFEELFEWLSLADLRALRQTCKRLKQVVDYFIKENYPAVKIGYIKIVMNHLVDLHQIDPVIVKMFKEAVLRVYFGDISQLATKEFAAIASIFPQLERLEIFVDYSKFDFYESILKWCSNLKYLTVTVPEMDEKRSDWLLHQYPTIEHFEIDFDSYLNCPLMELTTFLQLNPNIQTFSIKAQILPQSQVERNWFLGSNVRIEQFSVGFDNSICQDEHAYDYLCGILFNELYEDGFYERLHLYVSYVIDQSEIEQIELIRGLEKLYIDQVLTDQQFTWPSMPHLRELCIGDYSELWNTDSMAQNLINLERVYFRSGRTVDFISFIRYAPKVKEIKVDNLQISARFLIDGGAIDLSALNKERKGLTGACKVTIYVKESIFLSTKLATAKTEYTFVTLKRAEAVEWIHKFPSI